MVVLPTDFWRENTLSISSNSFVIDVVLNVIVGNMNGNDCIICLDQETNVSGPFSIDEETAIALDPKDNAVSHTKENKTFVLNLIH